MSGVFGVFRGPSSPIYLARAFASAERGPSPAALTAETL